MATRSNIASVIGSLADNSSDSDESDDESDSSDGLEVVEKRSTGKAGGTSYEESQETNTSYEETNTSSNITVRSLLTILKAKTFTEHNGMCVSIILSIIGLIFEHCSKA